MLEAYSVSHGKASPYLPVIELLKSYFDLKAEDDERKRREKVAGKVVMLDRSLEDTLPYLFALLGIDEQQSNLTQMDAQIRRRRTFDALKKVFLRESLNQPLILIFEDLHWIDNETQGFLDVLSESVASAKLLLLTNYRPEYRHEWGSKTYYTQLRLSPFGKAEAEEFLDVLLGVAVGADRRPKEVPVGRVGPPEPGAHTVRPYKTSNDSSSTRPKARRSSWKRWCRSWWNRGVGRDRCRGRACPAHRGQQQAAAPTEMHIPTDRARRPGRAHRPARS